MAFTNLLTAIYPIGSVYLSTISISPSSTIGGTWVQVKGATLAATGNNSFADAASYGGSLAININQMPRHEHANDIYSANWSATEDTLPNMTNAVQWGQYTNQRVRSASGWNEECYAGGGKTICLTTGAATFGIEPLNLYSFRGGEIIGIY